MCIHLPFLGVREMHLTIWVVANLHLGMRPAYSHFLSLGGARNRWLTLSL